MIITIDGPVASGKSTVAKKVAERLGFYYLATGLMFRGLAYLLMHKAGYSQQEMKAPRPKDLTLYLDPEKFVFTYDRQQGALIFFEGQNITPFLKDESIDEAASIMSTNQSVRESLLSLQRAIAAKKDVVAEGRDTGTVVFPAAEYKFFLTAPVAVRAQRWMSDQNKKGNMVTFDEALSAVSARDKRDATRVVAPLKKASDALEINNEGMSVAETVDLLLSHIDR